ncbi:ABC transporter ATP-binding protein [Pusillimonas sp.]|uniref:ABC transporter ATP-binding protein n=1 Tax=Pusillimonas sp. TaxID=3040095 RepID=UPI0037CA9F7D
MNAPLLSARNLSLRFGGFYAVHDLSLEFQPGCRLALIGPNGAGKTSLINLLTGVTAPTSGQVMLGDLDISSWGPASRVRAGLVRTFQINTLFGESSARESTALAIFERERLTSTFWRTARRYQHVWDEAGQLLTSLGLTGFLDCPVKELPYGRQRLVEIALALACRPRVLFLDEPAAGIPEGESEAVLDVIGSLPADLSVVLIEHDMQLVFRFAKEIAVLVAGGLLTRGSPTEVAADERVRQVYLGTTA